MFNKWIYIPFTKDGESEFVKAGSRIWAGLEYSNWHANDTVRRDKGISLGVSRQSPYHEFMAVGRARSSWSRLWQRNLMIRLHLKNSSGTFIDDGSLTDAFSVSQNYPNPFSDHTGINYSLNQEARVRLEITDLTGRVVLMKDEGLQPVGNHRLTIQNPGLSQGIYFYTLFAGENRQTRKMMVN